MVVMVAIGVIAAASERRADESRTALLERIEERLIRLEDGLENAQAPVPHWDAEEERRAKNIRIAEALIGKPIEPSITEQGIQDTIDAYMFKEYCTVALATTREDLDAYTRVAIMECIAPGEATTSHITALSCKRAAGFIRGGYTANQRMRDRDQAWVDSRWKKAMTFFINEELPTIKDRCRKEL
jgi:hypothetical protein